MWAGMSASDLASPMAAVNPILAWMQAFSTTTEREERRDSVAGPNTHEVGVRWAKEGSENMRERGGGSGLGPGAPAVAVGDVVVAVAVVLTRFLRLVWGLASRGVAVSA